MTFTKRATGGYSVHSGDVLVGTVKAHELWTVRGTKKIWTAYRKGSALASFESRNDAGAYLVNRFKA